MRRCLHCNRVLITRKLWGPAKDMVECKCGVRYAYEFIRDSSPEHWESVRKTDNYVRSDSGQLYVRSLGLNPRREKLKRAASSR